MNRERIIEILETYRPGEGLEADPEVRMALDRASADPELSRIRREIQQFDDSIKLKLEQIQVPTALREQILAAARRDRLVPGPVGQEHSRRISWFHPAAFAVAATIILFLALSFTFWKRPQAPRPAGDYPEISLADSGLLQTAHALYGSLRPKFKSKEGAQIQDYLFSNGGTVPLHLPANIAWDKSFACDVVEVNGNKVSIVCFLAPDNSRSLHLITFERSAFPDLVLPDKPSICREGAGCSATWIDDAQIHVLFSDKGEENLLAVLDI